MSYVESISSRERRSFTKRGCIGFVLVMPVLLGLFDRSCRGWHCLCASRRAPVTTA